MNLKAISDLVSNDVTHRHVAALNDKALKALC